MSFWQDEHLIVQNYAVGTRVRAGMATADVLAFCGRWRTADSVATRFPQFSRRALAGFLSDLVRFSLLQRADRQPTSAELAMARWGSWNPAAGYFHHSTKDVAYPWNPAQADRRLRRKAQCVPAPTPAKQYVGRSSTALPEPEAVGEFPEILLARRTWRAFSPSAVDAAALSALLRLTWGVQRQGHVPGQGPVVFKTSPSGGARHPIESYVLARNVSDVRPGLYHYDAVDHRLIALSSGASSRQIVTYLGGQSWFGKAAAVMLMTAVFEREQWKYQTARAYRAVLIDAGHLAQTFCLAATWLGLAPFCTMALADSRIEQALGVDGISESVVYAVGVGRRPAGAAPLGDVAAVHRL